MFQVKVIEGGPDIFNAICYGEAHPNTRAFIENQFDQLGQTIGNLKDSFFANARQIYDQINSSDAARLARLAIQKVRGIFERDEVKPLFDLEKIQSACLTMQRFIMAEPTIRQMYHNQQCDGFSNSYVDTHPNQIGDDHYDYRRVMQGMIVEDEEGYHHTTYLDEIYEGDRELTLEEQTDIINTWDIVKSFIQKNQDDPTSQFGNMF